MKIKSCFFNEIGIYETLYSKKIGENCQNKKNVLILTSATYIDLIL